MCNEQEKTIKTLSEISAEAISLSSNIDEHFGTISQITYNKGKLLQHATHPNNHIRELIKRILVATEIDTDLASDADQLASSARSLMQAISEAEAPVERSSRSVSTEPEQGIIDADNLPEPVEA
jgi:hypothetical protein